MNDSNPKHRSEDRESGAAPPDPRHLARQRGEPKEPKEPLDKIVRYLPVALRSGETAVELRSQQFHYPFEARGPALRDLGEELIAAKEPFSDRAEEFRALRGSLLGAVFSGSGKRALAVVSAEQGDGKTYLVSNLAVSFSQFAGRTLLIDANLRHPGLHRILGTKGSVGLSNLLAGEVPGENVVVPVAGVGGLHFLAAGPAVADPVWLLQGPRFSVLLEQMVESFDYVFVDTPSNESGPDARLIAARAGAALLVGRRGRSRVSGIKRLLSQLNMGPSLVAGVVLNQR